MFFAHRVDDEIELTLYTPLHAEQFYALVDRNRDHLGCWLRWVNCYESVSDAVAFAEGNLQRMADMSAMGCLVWYRGDLAGWVELFNIDRSKRIAEIGYWLGEEYENRGIAYRAVTALVQHGFTCLDLAIIDAKVSPSNGRSRALLEDLGFAVEAEGDSVDYRIRSDHNAIVRDQKL